MSEKNIIEILSSDTLETIVDKLNGNFRQLSSLGGGPQGPQGKQGIPGLPGLQGPQGIQGEEGEAGTKIVPISDNGWPLKEDMEENTLYFGMDGNGNLMIRTLDSDTSEIEETEIVSNEKIDLQGFFEQLYVASSEQACLRMCKQYSNEPILLIGRGEGSESIFANTINNSTDLFPNVHSKLQLNTTKNRTKTVKVYPGNAEGIVSSSSSSMVFMSNENGSASIGLVSSSPIGPNGVIVSGYNGENSDLYVDGDIYSYGNFLTQFSGTKTFGGVGTDGTDGTFNFGHVNISDDTTTLKGGMSISSDAVTVKSVGDMTLSSGNVYTIEDNRSDASNTLITLESNSTEDSQILSITKNVEENEKEIVSLADDGTSFDFTLNNLGVTTTGLAGARKWEWESARLGTDYAQFVFNDNDSEKGGLYIDVNRLSYYGNDGMQIKLNSFGSYNRRNEDSTSGTTPSDEHNLIEFVVDTEYGSREADYYTDNGSHSQKIGDMTGTKSIYVYDEYGNHSKNISREYYFDINSFRKDLRIHVPGYGCTLGGVYRKRNTLASYKFKGTNGGKAIATNFSLVPYSDGYIYDLDGGKYYVVTDENTSTFFEKYFDTTNNVSTIKNLPEQAFDSGVGSTDTDNITYKLFKTGRNTGKLIINTGGFGGLTFFNNVHQGDADNYNFNLIFVLDDELNDALMSMFGKSKMSFYGTFTNGQTDGWTIKDSSLGEIYLEKFDAPICARVFCTKDGNNDYHYMLELRYKYCNMYKNESNVKYYYTSKWSECEFNLIDERSFADVLYWDSDDED